MRGPTVSQALSKMTAVFRSLSRPWQLHGNLLQLPYACSQFAYTSLFKRLPMPESFKRCSACKNPSTSPAELLCTLTARTFCQVKSQLALAHSAHPNVQAGRFWGNLRYDAVICYVLAQALRKRRLLLQRHALQDASKLRACLGALALGRSEAERQQTVRPHPRLKTVHH